MSEYYSGIHEAVVRDLGDPLGEGRARLLVPSVLGQAMSAWARPVLGVSSVAGATVGSRAWVLFEHGNLSRPTWFADLPDLTGASQGATDRLAPTSTEWLTEYNTTIDSGHYVMDPSATNAPVAQLCYLEVRRYSSNYAIQTAIEVVNERKYTRFLKNGVWGPWVADYDLTGVGVGGITLGANVIAAGEGVSAYRNENTVTLGVYVQATGVVSNALTLPVGWYPRRQLRADMNPTISTNRAVLLNTSGVLSVEGGLTTGQLLFGSMTYVRERF